MRKAQAATEYIFMFAFGTILALIAIYYVLRTPRPAEPLMRNATSSYSKSLESAMG